MVSSESSARSNLHRFEHAQRGPGRGIASGAPWPSGAARDVPRFARDDLHVFHARADIFCSDITPAQRRHGASEGAEQRMPVIAAFRLAQHCLGAAKGQVGERVLVAHPLGEPERIVLRLLMAGVTPKPAAARARAERGGVDRNQPRKPRRRVVQPDEVLRRRTIGSLNHEIPP
jgi:hypothetical protein